MNPGRNKSPKDTCPEIHYPVQANVSILCSLLVNNQPHSIKLEIPDNLGNLSPHCVELKDYLHRVKLTYNSER